MFFVIETTYVEDNAALWSRHVQDHLGYWQTKLPIVLAAGGILGGAGQTIGALYIVEADGEATARV